MNLIQNSCRLRLAGLSQSSLGSGLYHLDQLKVFREFALQPVTRHEMVIQVNSSALTIT